MIECPDQLNGAMKLDAMDEYDIRRCFEVLDEDKTQTITLSSFHTLYLGLGYPKNLTLSQLKDKVREAIDERRDRSDASANISVEDGELLDADIDGKESFLPLSLVLEVLSNFQRDRNYEIDQCFRLLDSNDKGFVTAEDLLRMSTEVGEPMSSEAAEVLVPRDMDAHAFARELAPPSP